MRFFNSLPAGRQAPPARNCENCRLQLQIKPTPTIFWQDYSRGRRNRKKRISVKEEKLHVIPLYSGSIRKSSNSGVWLGCEPHGTRPRKGFLSTFSVANCGVSVGPLQKANSRLLILPVFNSKKICYRLALGKPIIVGSKIEPTLHFFGIAKY